jgi:uncharacterized membrane protein YhaH (DUF805 family)
MRPLIEFLFPKRLARLSYFIRLLLCDGLIFFLYQDFSGEGATGNVAFIVVVLYACFFVMLPRIRDIGMSAWWLILAFIPYISAFLGIALLFRRTNPQHNPLLRHPSATPPPLQPNTEA